MIAYRGPADRFVLGCGGAQFVIGSTLEGEHEIVGIREDLVELALCRALMAPLRVLDDEHHGQRQRRHQRLENDLPAPLRSY